MNQDQRPVSQHSWYLKGRLGGEGSHHGQLSLQLLHPVVLEVQLGAQRRGVVRGLLGLAPKLPLLPLQQVLLLSQSFDGVLALLRGENARASPWAQARQKFLHCGA